MSGVSSALRPLDFRRPFLDDVDAVDGVLRLGLVTRARSWAVVHRRSLAVLGVLLPLAAVVHAWGMYRSPGIDVNDDEGTYVSQAWAVDTWHQLSHYTYWYDHPPLGWMQLAAWVHMTGGWSRAPFAVAAGREFMLVVDVAACGLLYVLARRLHVSRPAAAAALVLFAACPLALHLHRMVWLDAIGTAWLLGALLCAASPRMSLASAVGSALCTSVAVLTKETLAVLAPVVLMVLWQHSHPRTRRYRVTAFTTLTVVITLFYPLYALVKSELFEGPGHVSLLWAIRWQLTLRESNGSVLTPHSGAWDVVHSWVQLDPWLLVAGVVAAVPALVVRRLRPIGLGLLLQAGMMLRHGYLPQAYVVAVLPFAALLAAAVPDAVLRAPRLGRWWRALLALPLAAACAAVTPAWVAGDTSQLRSPDEVPMRTAMAWVRTHIPTDRHMLVDDNIWLDLVRAGYPADTAQPSVLWVYKLGTDPAIKLQSVDYFVYAMNPIYAAHDIPQVVQLYANSAVVATFGSGDNQIVVRQVTRGTVG